jgi:malyl-CoA/(S)-citramalyl-CoA lyase
MDEASRDGKGAVSLDGRLIDAASLRMAEHLLTKIELIEERRNGSTPAPVENIASAS